MDTKSFDYNNAVTQIQALAKGLNLSHSDSFTGTHRGITFKISRHNGYEFTGGNEMRRTHNCWCYYIYLREANFSAADWADVFQSEPRIYDRSGGEKQVCRESSRLDDCNFHGGITWFHAECDPYIPSQVILEVGCDYQHLWDREGGYRYDVEDILSDVKRTVDKLHETFPVRVWSRVDGTYHPEAEIEAYNAEAHKRLWPDAADKETAA